MMPKKASIVNTGFEEFLLDEVKEKTGGMPWMKEKEFILMSTLGAVTEYVDEAIEAGLCALDLETDGLNTRMEITPEGKVPVGKIVGFCLSYDVGKGIYIPINHIEGEELNLPEKEVLAEIKRLCSNCITLYHNAKFDLSFLSNYGIVVDQFQQFEDTLLLGRLFDAGQKDNGLKSLSSRLLKQPMLDFSTVTKSANRFDLISPEVGYIYAASDAVCTLGLFHHFMAQDIIQQQKSIYNLEKRTLIVVMEMCSNLIKIDGPYLEALKGKSEKRLKEIETEIFKLAGKEFKLSSPQQLGAVLFNDLGFQYPSDKKTASGQYMTDNATLSKIAETYPVVKSIMEYRGLEKSLGTYITNLLINRDKEGFVKLNFNQVGTDTGRFSSPGGKGIHIDGFCGVNIQSIPSNYSDNTPDVRKAFIARPGMQIVCMDYAGEELRVATNLSREPKWVNEFLNGDADLHSATGRVIFGREKITKAERQIAKCVARGTLIASERGWIPIENLNKGDRVITHTGDLKKITKVWDMGTKPGVRIKTRTGHEITCGENHRFLSTKDKWIKACKITAGQEIKTVSCKKMKPKSVSRKFLSALFEADGTVSKTGVSITTKDRELAGDILLLLASFGMRACIWTKESKRYQRDYYKVSMGVEASELFEKEIGFISKSKKDRLHKLTHKVFKRTKGSYRLKWETEVKSVNYLKEVPLMDLTVEGDHTYVAQGLVTHNTANFLTLYGGGPRGLSQQAKISEREAKKILVQFFAGLPVLKKWIDAERVLARKLKYSRTAMGRVRPLHMYYNSGDRGLEAHADRCAVNHKIQGSCADIMKTAMVRIRSWIQMNHLQDEIKILITMHDEVVFEMPKDKLHVYIPQLYSIMKLEDILQGILKWPIPFDIDAEYGDTWHISNDFYKENPDADKDVKVDFHRTSQIVEKMETAVPKVDIITKDPVTEPTPVEKTPVVESVPAEKVASAEPSPIKEVVAAPKKDESGDLSILDISEVSPTKEVVPETKEKKSEPVESSEKKPAETPSDPPAGGNKEEKSLTGNGTFVYTIRDRSKSTQRTLNSILTFLLAEGESTAKYEGPKKILKIRDKDGNSLLISEYVVRVDSFLALARFFGV